MPDVFLSYSREDQGIARRFAEGLSGEGFSVWWDQSLSAGEDFDRVTEQALADSRAVVVLWSLSSVDSRWVRAEATEAKANNRLVPVMIEPCKRPILFELTHTADLVNWQGDAKDPRWRSLIDGLRRMTNAGASHPSPALAPGAAQPTSVPPAAPRKPWLPIAITGAAVLIAGGLAWYFYGRTQAPAPATAQVAGTDASIAVLPFVNMSADPEQEHFSDGLSEELINQLAHIDGLLVTARTSAFSFKGKSQDLRAVGRALGVAHILEGSVRKSGGRIRITAQLINSATGYYVWSETFDRKVDDVFAIQDEIATAVAGKLGPTLGVVPRTADYGGTRSFEAYDHLLRGNAASTNQSADSLQAAINEYRAAATIDPTYARAWAELAISIPQRSVFTISSSDAAALDREREEAIARAMKLAPNAPLTHVAKMWLHSDRHEWIEADNACKAVFAAGPDPRAEGICGGFLTLTGRVRAATPYREAMRQADPLSSAVAAIFMRHYSILGMEPELRREFGRMEGLTGARWLADEAMLAYLVHSRAPQEEISAQLARACPMETPACAAWTAAIRTPQQAPAQLRAQLQAIRESRPGIATSIALAAAYVGDTTLALDALEVFTSKAGAPTFQTMWYPPLGTVRKDARFKRILRDVGFVDLWQRTGSWADFCHPTGAGDFECY